MTAPDSATQLIVHGRVQGVFYRDWTVRNARERGLSGWVRNLADGTVEARIEGEAAAIEDMIAAMRQGPPRARVERIERADAEPCGLTGFERR
jgi:acylphosphatase